MQQWDKKGSLSDSCFSNSTDFCSCEVPTGFACWTNRGLTQNIRICYNLRFGANNKWCLRCFWLNRLLHLDSKCVKLLVFPSFWQNYRRGFLLTRFKSPPQLGRLGGAQPAAAPGVCCWVEWPQRCSFTSTQQRAECCCSCQHLPVL